MTKDNGLSERDGIVDEAFRVLLDWYMVSDPWPLDDQDKAVVFGFLAAEAHKRGFTDVIEAYHEFDPGEDG